jgi:hypothetical protein
MGWSIVMEITYASCMNKLVELKILTEKKLFTAPTAV